MSSYPAFNGNQRQNASASASASTNPPPPTPHTNRRILHDLATTAEIPIDRLKSLHISLIGSETMKRKDLMSGGAFFGPEGIKLIARGKKPLELDEIDAKVVKKAAKTWMTQELDEIQVKKVEKAGILKIPRGIRKKAEAIASPPATGNLTGTQNVAVNVGKNSGKKGKKRALDEVEFEDQEQSREKEIEIDWDEEIDYPWDCNEIRRKIRTFIENGGMKVTAFQRAIETNSNSYGRFMKLRGPWAGNNNNTFDGATRFFKAREAAHLPMPKKPKTAATSTRKDPQGPDLSTIHLEGEDEDKVPIFDSCDEIRRKIAAHLRKPGVTQAQFLRDIAEGIKTQQVRIQGKQLTDFRAKSGALWENTSRVYYGAYVYFEKCRIQEGKEKSKHRVEMEKRWPANSGVDIKIPGNRGRVLVREGQIPSLDQYGVLHIYDSY